MIINSIAELEVIESIAVENCIDKNITSIEIYKGIEGAFYTDAYNLYWLPSVYDFEVNEEGKTYFPNAVWIKSLR